MNRILKSIAIMSLFFLISQTGMSQTVITLEGFGGWLWTGSAGYDGSIKVDDKGNYGARIGVAPRSQMVIEFEWNHTETALRWREFQSSIESSEAVTMNYYMLGFNQEVSEGPAVPFGVFNIGVMNLKGQTTNWSENWFTIGLGGGLKYYFSDRIGIRLQARLFLPMQFAGVGFGCGTGGCGTGVSGYTSIIQGDFTGGVVLKLGGS